MESQDRSIIEQVAQIVEQLLGGLWENGIL
jgi:phage-related protein